MPAHNPVSVAERRVQREYGFEIAYRVYRPVGMPMGTAILVHGLASFGRQFERDAEHFTTLGYRVIAPDLRGHGEGFASPFYFGRLARRDLLQAQSSDGPRYRPPHT